jgi:hypothetical protein
MKTTGSFRLGMPAIPTASAPDGLTLNEVR